VELIVNQKSIGMNAFVQDIVFNVVRGILQALEDVPDEAARVTFKLSGEEATGLQVDQQDVRMNAFVRSLVGGILQAILRVLDGIPEFPETVTVQLR